MMRFVRTLLFIAAVIGPVGSYARAQGPDDITIRSLAEATVRRHADEMMTRCAGLGPRMDISRSSILTRGVYNSEAKYWPYRIQVAGTATCPNSAVDFVTVLALRLGKDDFNRWQVRSEETETRSLNDRTAQVLAAANAAILAQEKQRRAARPAALEALRRVALQFYSAEKSYFATHHKYAIEATVDRLPFPFRPPHGVVFRVDAGGDTHFLYSFGDSVIGRVYRSSGNTDTYDIDCSVGASYPLEGVRCYIADEEVPPRGVARDSQASQGKAVTPPIPTASGAVFIAGLKTDLRALMASEERFKLKHSRYAQSYPELSSDSVPIGLGPLTSYLYVRGTKTAYLATVAVLSKSLECHVGVNMPGGSANSDSIICGAIARAGPVAATTDNLFGEWVAADSTSRAALWFLERGRWELNDPTIDAHNASGSYVVVDAKHIALTRSVRQMCPCAVVLDGPRLVLTAAAGETLAFRRR